VVITADHKELKRGKPFPDPFILAATKMGHDVKRCLVVEDSPSGIKAGVASGATVIAVCTSHPSEKVSFIWRRIASLTPVSRSSTAARRISFPIWSTWMWSPRTTAGS
jgi:beta-phosphoglucomutase-like phosphatase (HAD superfamily)